MFRPIKLHVFGWFIRELGAVSVLGTVPIFLEVT